MDVSLQDKVNVPIVEMPIVDMHVEDRYIVDMPLHVADDSHVMDDMHASPLLEIDFLCEF